MHTAKVKNAFQDVQILSGVGAHVDTFSHESKSSHLGSSQLSGGAMGLVP
jgi:hypothetical protein